MTDNHTLVITQLLPSQKLDVPFKNKLHCGVFAEGMQTAQGTSMGKHSVSTNLLSTY